MQHLRGLGFEDTNQESSVWTSRAAFATHLWHVNSKMASADLPFRSETASSTPLTLLCSRPGRFYTQNTILHVVRKHQVAWTRKSDTARKVICDVGREEET